MRAILAGLMLTTVATAQVVPDAIYYRFNEGAGATTANAASPGVGSLNAPLTIQTFGPGYIGTGLMGTGTGSSHVNSGWTTNLVGTSWTMEYWINPALVTTTISYLIGDTTSGLRCFWGGVAGAGNIIIRANGVTDCTITGCVNTPNVWSHVAFVYDYSASPRTLTGYLNGVPVVTSVQTGTGVTLPGGTFYVGNYSATTVGLNGAMDEVRLWLSARTAGEIASSYLGELYPNNIFTATTTGGGAGDLTMSLTAISPSATEGYVFLSQQTSGGIGTGPFFGLMPDGLTWSGVNTPIAPGNPLHFPIGIGGIFPDQPFLVPPGTLTMLAGQTWDTVAVVFAPGTVYTGRSSVQRLAW